jgi:hypothetical protein
MHATIALPYYPQNELTGLDVEQLADILVLDEDRVPRNVIDECARRGDHMVECLQDYIDTASASSPAGDLRDLWFMIHCGMILGLIPTANAKTSLAALLRVVTAKADGAVKDWLHTAWPAFFRNKPSGVLDEVKAVAENRELQWTNRRAAVDAVIAIAQNGSADELNAALAWAAQLAADPSEDQNMRIATGFRLTNFPRPGHRYLLDSLVTLQAPDNILFTPQDIADAYARGSDAPEWDYWQNPWQFYEPVRIAERQKCWAIDDAAGELDDEAEEIEFDIQEDFDVEAFSEGQDYFRGDKPFKRDYQINVDEFIATRRIAPQRPHSRDVPKYSGSDRCPCGSGKTYKKCCMTH